MQDRLIFLGTAGGVQAVGKQRKSLGGIVLQTEGLQFHIDPGPGALLNLRAANINPRENTALLISHAHIAHYSDLIAVIAATSIPGSDPKAQLIVPHSMIGTDNTIAISYLPESLRKSVEKILVVKAGNTVKVKQVQIYITKAMHLQEPDALGFKFLCPKFTLGYTGDTQYYKNMDEEYKGMDILILNVQEPFGKKKQGHLSADDAVTIITKVKPKLSILTHFGTNFGEEDPLILGREVNKRTNAQVIIAKDGLVVNPVVSSSGSRQKTLNVYE